ncbi:arginine--tRNA ligase [Streptomyces sp. ST2-7A]|uniref:arginine--tRNA ligase n=1 Tax=Streptomyces sp. ST2-7A TaxID=2907214 RepID=UPI001F1D6267|nr:arginine--tRNA ligase [Streptomyces sp. ST2-7A]MCE7081791.1 hypothetical protein [Streptomyces sp. ST2-7A]
MTPAQLSDAVLRSVRHAVRSGELCVAVPGRAGVRRPPHGDADWSTGIALALAGPAGRPGREVAETLRAHLSATPGVARVEVAGPGFLDIHLADAADVAVLAPWLDAPPIDPWPEDPARDVARWAAVAGGDPAELLTQREPNPLFTVRWAHARCRALSRGGAAMGLTPALGDGATDAAGAPETATPAEAGRSEVVRLIAEYPRLRDALTAALDGEGTPGEAGAAVARFLFSLADTFLAAETTTPALPVGEEKPGAVHRVRLAVALATGTVLADGLHRLGVNAPDHL